MTCHQQYKPLVNSKQAHCTPCCTSCTYTQSAVDSRTRAGFACTYSRPDADLHWIMSHVSFHAEVSYAANCFCATVCSDVCYSKSACCENTHMIWHIKGRRARAYNCKTMQAACQLSDPDPPSTTAVEQTRILMQLMMMLSTHLLHH
jgi:hypothetical protein